MAKINHQNFVDTINNMLTEARKRGVIHLEFDGDDWQGNMVKVGRQDLVNFGTCGYMGLESHPHVIEKTIDFTRRFGTQFSVSRSYLTSKQNMVLEDHLSHLFDNKPVIVFTSTTLAHLSVLPILVGHRDAIILDQQAHISIQTAAQQMAPKGVPIDLIRHSNLEMLEQKIKSIYEKHEKIWYMIDGVYSMYGDLAPMDEINKLMARYDKLHLYIDDAHGMSWYGKNGCGRSFEKCMENGKTMYMTTLAKGFGAMGGIAVFPGHNWYNKVILHGGPLAYSHPIPPPMMGAAIASAEIHLSPEITIIQQSLRSKLDYANELFSTSPIPVLSNPETPIYFVGTGQPNVGYNLNKRIIDEGFYVNIGMFPAVPVKNTGLRFTITNHNSHEQIKTFFDALAYHYPLALADEGKTLNEVRRAFRLPDAEIPKMPEKKPGKKHLLEMNISHSIHQIDKEMWNYHMDEKTICDWDNMALLEAAFSNNTKPEDNLEFLYMMVKDPETAAVILCTFFTLGIYKDDLLAPESVSRKIEQMRADNPYYLTSKTLAMGSLATEGDHLYLDRTNPHWKNAADLMLQTITEFQEKYHANTIIMRDFSPDDQEISDIFYEHGLIRISMPNSNEIENLDLSSTEQFLAGLSKKGRYNVRRFAVKSEPLFDIEFRDHLSEAEIAEFYALHDEVRQNNFAVNIFSYPLSLFQQMNKSNDWEFLIARLKATGELLSYGACYKAKSAYCPVVIGINYEHNQTYKVYKQMLYQVVKRAYACNYKRIHLGLTADLEKKNLGAVQKKRVAFIQSSDNYNFELIENTAV